MFGKQARSAATVSGVPPLHGPSGAAAPAARGDEEQEQFRGPLGWLRAAGPANHSVLPGKEGPPEQPSRGTRSPTQPPPGPETSHLGGFLF